VGYLKYVRELWKNPKSNLGDLWRSRLIKWRRDPASVRVEHPTRIDKARSLGYKAKQGYVVVRQRVLRGGHERQHYRGGRRSRRLGIVKNLTKNYRQIAEERAQQHYVNCSVLNSYWVAEDGRYKWYEVILVDRSHPSVTADPRISWISDKRGRAERGITSAGRKARGLYGKGKGREKMRPSLRSHNRTGN
jgi:large subunit ribosomal protein L15e